jgi:hypothetical protein
MKYALTVLATLAGLGLGALINERFEPRDVLGG